MAAALAASSAPGAIAGAGGRSPSGSASASDDASVANLAGPTCGASRPVCECRGRGMCRPTRRPKPTSSSVCVRPQLDSRDGLPPRDCRVVGGRRAPDRAQAHLDNALLLVASAHPPPAWPAGSSCSLAPSSPLPTLPALLARAPHGSTPGIEVFDEPFVRPAKGPAAATDEP